MPQVMIKRAYRAARRSDGTRVLVDALWPRGLSRERLRLDRWCKDVAPSASLRRWFGHDPARWEEFRTRYTEELAERGEELDHLCALSKEGTLTLVYAAKDEKHNNAVVLRDVIEAGRLDRSDDVGARGGESTAQGKKDVKRGG